MRIKLFLAALAAIAVLASCSQEAKHETTAKGTEFIRHIDKGGERPQPGDYVYFHAQIRNGDSLVNGSRATGQEPFFQIPAADSPQEVPLAGEILPLMGIGDSVTVLVRLDTLPSKPPGFEEADVLYYDLVMTDIKSQEDYFREQDEKRRTQQEHMETVKARAAEVAASTKDMAAKYAAGDLSGQLQETNSGLKYIIHEQGAGKQAAPGNKVDVQYYGVLPDGTTFDNSFERGQAFSFPLGAGRVIPGWDEGIALLSEGAKATLFIPYNLAYGEAGSPPTIPPRSELIFYVELEKAY